MVNVVRAVVMTPPAPYTAPPPPSWYTEWATASTVLIYAFLMFIALVLLAFFGVMLFLIWKLNKKLEPVLGKAPPVAKKVEAMAMTGSDRVIQAVIEFHAWDTAIRTAIRAFFHPSTAQLPARPSLHRTPLGQELVGSRAPVADIDSLSRADHKPETDSGRERQPHVVG